MSYNVERARKEEANCLIVNLTHQLHELGSLVYAKRPFPEWKKKLAERADAYIKKHKLLKEAGK
ncbi:hypothetical protein IID24_03280 [Patescibacteria group bacterium]|nr:hypothetical protein [Patescibacteria group bacterium]